MPSSLYYEMVLIYIFFLLNLEDFNFQLVIDTGDSEMNTTDTTHHLTELKNLRKKQCTTIIRK